MTVVPVPADLMKVPELLKLALAPPVKDSFTWASKLAPGRLLNTAPLLPAIP
jgi:hypothetical protein